MPVWFRWIYSWGYKGQAIIVCENPLEVKYIDIDKKCKNIKCQVPLKGKAYEGIKVNIVLEDETVMEITLD